MHVFKKTLFLTGCKQATPPAEMAEAETITLEMNTEKINSSKNRFLGSWELEEWSIESKDGIKSALFGDDAIGKITYESNGNMFVQIMNNNRPKFRSDDPLQALPEEAINAYYGFIAYAGPYEVDTLAN